MAGVAGAQPGVGAVLLVLATWSVQPEVPDLDLVAGDGGAPVLAGAVERLIAVVPRPWP